MWLLLCDKIEPFLRCVGLTDLLGPAHSVKCVCLLFQSERDLCSKLLVVALRLTVHGQGVLPLLQDLLEAADRVLLKNSALRHFFFRESDDVGGAQTLCTVAVQYSKRKGLRSSIN